MFPATAFRRIFIMKFHACLAVALLLMPAATMAVELDDAIKTIQAVGPNAQGNVAASPAWKKLSQAEAGDLPRLLAALNGANPLAANWIRSAVEAVADREAAGGRKLPAAQLETFVKQTKHDPRGRRLAFELLISADPAAEARLLSGMLHDPSVELRRDAVAQLLNTSETDREKVLEIHRQAFAAAVDDDQVKHAAAKLKELGEKVDIAGHYGFLMNWRLLGPFDNKDEKGYAATHGPEGKPLDLSAKFTGSHDTGEIQWIEHSTVEEYGTVDLNKALGKHKGAICYAAAFFESPAERDVHFRLTSKNACKLWLNGKLIDAREVYHSDGGPNIDQYISTGRLVKGRNTILLKICQNEQSEPWAQDWRFHLRISDFAGEAISSVK
jgi:hypothetical protein